jgi:hypothetical protein
MTSKSLIDISFILIYSPRLNFLKYSKVRTLKKDRERKRERVMDDIAVQTKGIESKIKSIESEYYAFFSKLLSFEVYI